MGLAIRIIPTALVRGHELVKGRQFHSWRSVGHAMQAAQIYAARECDEIILLDIGNGGLHLNIVRAWTNANFSPITVGGGVRTKKDVGALLESGADKVSVNKALYLYPKEVYGIAKAFGSQALVGSIDVDGSDDALRRAKHAQELGVGEILLTSIDREGMMQGYDLELIRAVASQVDIPVIAHGGCGTPEHMYEAIKAGASAVAAGAMFCFSDITPKDCARYLLEKGVEVRYEEENLSKM